MVRGDCSSMQVVYDRNSCQLPGIQPCCISENSERKPARLSAGAMPQETDVRTLPWYKPEIGPRLKPRARKLFEIYSGINPNDLEEHLHTIVSNESSFAEYFRLA